MKSWFIFFIFLTGCIHSKNQSDRSEMDLTKLTILAKSKAIGETFKAHLDDSESSMIDLLENCTRDACDSSSEKAIAGRLKELHVALRDKDTTQIKAYSDRLVEDFHKLITTYSDQREYIVPVTFQAWFLAGAIYPYSKTVSQELFTEVKLIRKVLDNRSPKPVGYFFLVALESEYQAGRLVDKVQAYKKCIDTEPSNRRCQDSYLRLSAQSPKAIKTSESNLAKECRPEIDKSGFTLRIGTSTVNRSYMGPKPFYGKKYYFDRQDLLGVSEIEAIYWNTKGPTIVTKITDQGTSKLKNILGKLKNKGLVLVKKEMIFAVAPASSLFKDEPRGIKFLMVDKKGLNELVRKCP